MEWCEISTVLEIAIIYKIFFTSYNEEIFWTKNVSY